MRVITQPQTDWNMSMLKREEMVESQMAKMEKRKGKFVDLSVIKDKV